MSASVAEHDDPPPPPPPPPADGEGGEARSQQLAHRAGQAASAPAASVASALLARSEMAGAVPAQSEQDGGETEEEEDPAREGGSAMTQRQLVARGRRLLTQFQRQKKASNGARDGAVVLRSDFLRATPKEGGAQGNIESARREDGGLSIVKASSVGSLSVALPPASSSSSSSSPASSGDKRWSDFMQLLDQNARTHEAINQQLAVLWGLMVADQAAHPSIARLNGSVARLMQQKSSAETAMTKLAEVLGSRVFLSGKLQDDAVQFLNGQLKLELQRSDAVVAELDAELRSLQKTPDGAEAAPVPAPASRGRSATAVGPTESSGAPDPASALRKELEMQRHAMQKLQLAKDDADTRCAEAERRACESREAVERLEGELEQQEKAAADKRTLLQRALAVKSRQLEQLCASIELPRAVERWTDDEGVTFFRRNDRACAPELEDPRAEEAAARLGAADSSVSMAGVMRASPLPSPQYSSDRRRELLAADSPLRRSFSSPHMSSGVDVDDLVAAENCPVPPDDGRKHKINDFSTPLPAGWEMRVTTAGAVYFLNKYTNTTTWSDPRAGLEGPAAPPSASRRHSSAADSRSSRTATGSMGLSDSQAETDYTDFDVVFEARGPIGIHFQASVPDRGATVRGLLTDMAAEASGLVEPFDRLVAVNKHSVEDAPFRHVMLLLQGGLRPLTLTFRRETAPRSAVSSDRAGSDGRRSAPAESVGFDDGGGLVHLDEEVVVDQAPARPQAQALRVPAARDAGNVMHRSLHAGDSAVDLSVGASRRERGAATMQEEDLTVADRIITGVFSLFWTTPADASSDLHTV